jgi:hypothetical protein
MSRETTAVSRFRKRSLPMNCSVTMRGLAVSLSRMKSKGIIHRNSSLQRVTDRKSCIAALAFIVICSMGKVPLSHCTRKRTESPSSSTCRPLTVGFSLDTITSVL